MASWELEKSAPFLPTSIQFDSVPRFETSIHHFTNAIFRAYGITNIGKLGIPTKVSAQYFVGMPTNALKIVPGPTAMIIVTNVEPKIGIEGFDVAMTGLSMISDLRTITPATPFAIPVGMTKKWPSIDSTTEAARRTQASGFSGQGADGEEEKLGLGSKLRL
jgi:hypothetical protein